MILIIIFKISLYFNFTNICKKIIDRCQNNIENGKYFKETCINGNLEIAKYIINKKNNYKIIINYEELFVNLCKNNKINIAQWLLSINDNLNNTNFLEYIFIMFSFSSNINILEWLLKIDTNININIHNNLVFKHACINGNIDIIKLLFKLNNNIDISCIKNYLYLNENLNKCKETLQWITFNNSKYAVYCEDGNIKCKIKMANSIKNINNIENCIICFDRNCNIITNCDHQYCLECISLWYYKEKSCPICRKNDKLQFFEIKYCNEI